MTIYANFVFFLEKNGHKKEKGSKQKDYDVKTGDFRQILKRYLLSIKSYETKLFNMNRKMCWYHESCEPLRIFWNDDTACSTWVSCVLPITGWIPGFSACSGQHAWHSCRAGRIVISENPQGLATHMVQSRTWTAPSHVYYFSFDSTTLIENFSGKIRIILEAKAQFFFVGFFLV